MSFSSYTCWTWHDLQLTGGRPQYCAFWCNVSFVFDWWSEKSSLKSNALIRTDRLNKACLVRGFGFHLTWCCGQTASLSAALLCLEHIVPVHSALKMKLVGRPDVNELPGVWNVDKLEDYFLVSGTTDYKLLGCKTHPGLQFQGHQILLLRASERVSGCSSSSNLCTYKCMRFWQYSRSVSTAFLLIKYRINYFNCNVMYDD